MTRTLASLALAVPVLLLGLDVTAQAQGRCERLWVERNSIYKDAGYCFRTRRAVDYFGNEGCEFDSVRDLRLSRSERAHIADIMERESDLGCPP